VILTCAANACGTIGILHSVAAATLATTASAQWPFASSLEDGTWFAKFFRTTASMTPDERAEELDKDEEAAESHDEVVAQVRACQPT
jgi:hypothetical protein